VGYRDDDAFSAFTREADSAYPLGEEDPADPATWIGIARRASATAIWVVNGPGGSVTDIGVAAEREGLTWLGLSPTDSGVSDPEQVRHLAFAAGVPCVPTGTVSSAMELDAFVAHHGTPCEMTGRGGSLTITDLRDVDDIAGGMPAGPVGRIVRRAYPHSRRVAVSAHRGGDGRVTTLATMGLTRDRNGDAILLETPAPCDESVRRQIVESATRLAVAGQLVGVFLAEYVVGEEGPLLDSSRPLGPLGEAERGSLSCALDDDVAVLELGRAPARPASTPRHTVTAVIRAEEPAAGLARVRSKAVPGGPGVHTASSVDDEGFVQTGDGVLALITATAGRRDDALPRARRALQEQEFTGVATNIAGLRLLLDSAAMEDGTPSTQALASLNGNALPPAYAATPPLSWVDRLAITVDGRSAQLLAVHEE